MSRHGNCVQCATAFPNRRAVIATLTATAVLPATSPLFAAAEVLSTADDERFMLIRDGRVLARGRNLGRTNDDPTAHGEMTAIRRCLATHGSKALISSTLYTSGEPCAMCMGAILWCRIGRLVYAASVQQLASKIDQIMISSADVAAKAPFAPISITGGVLADEAMQLFAK
jgi:tRNA(adenine34) deaminase